MGDPTGLTLPVAIEELFWGDAGIGLAIIGSGLAAAGIAGNGTPEQVMEWVPQCYGTADEMQLGAFCVSEPDAGSDVSSLRTRGRLRRGQGRVGAQRHQGVDHQRRHRRRPRGRRRGRSRARRAAARRASSCRPAPRASSQGQKYKKHGIRASHTAEVVLDDVRVPGSLPARRQGEARRQAGPGPRGQKPRRRGKQPAMATFEATRPAVGAPGASASPAPPTSTRSTTPRSARRSASRSS